MVPSRARRLGYPASASEEETGTTRRRAFDAEVLARHYRQLRTSHGTVLLGQPVAPGKAPRLETRWFVSGCPLDVAGAVDALRERHDLGSRADALRALHEARATLAAASHPDAAALHDVPRALQRA